MIDGIVEKGLGESGLYDFPTANVKTNMLPGFYVGLTNFGSGFCIVGNGIAEIHIIGFSGDLYGKSLTMTDMLKVNDFLVERYINIYLAARGLK